MCVASWLAHNTLKSEVCRTNGVIFVICRPRSGYCFKQSKPEEILQEIDRLYFNFSVLRQLKVMPRNVCKARTASLSYYKTLKLQNHWNNWFLLQKTTTQVITGGISAGLWAKSCLEGDKESKAQRNNVMAAAHEQRSEPRSLVAALITTLSFFVFSDSGKQPQRITNTTWVCFCQWKGGALFRWENCYTVKKMI